MKPILDPGNKAQTIGNQIVVLPNGDLVMLFNLIRNVGTPTEPRLHRGGDALDRQGRHLVWRRSRSTG